MREFLKSPRFAWAGRLGRMKPHVLLVLAALGLSACDKVAGMTSTRPTAKAACEKLVAAGIGTNCKEVSPKGLSAKATSKYDFDLVAPKGEQGAVMSFESADDYKSTSEAYKAAALLAGPHRYGNEKALIFMQMNDGASLDDGKKAKAVIEGL